MDAAIARGQQLGRNERPASPSKLAPLSKTPVQKTPREVLVLLRDRDGALAYEAFPLQQKGSIPAVVLAEEALAEFRRANNLAESNERLTGLKCCVGPPGLENDATTIIDTFLETAKPLQSSREMDPRESLDAVLRRNVEMSRDAFDRTGRRYAVLWCASPRQLVSSCTVQLRVVAQRKVAFAMQRRWRGVDVLAMETSQVVKRVVSGLEDEKPFERWAPAYTPSVADVETWFASGNSVYVSLTSSDSTLSTRPCRNGGTTIQEVMMASTTCSCFAGLRGPSPPVARR